MMSGSNEENCARWVDLVQKVTSGDTNGFEELYGDLSGAVRAGLAHSVPLSSVEDATHEVLVILLEAILNGELRDARRLMGFLKTVAQRRAVAYVRSAVCHRRRFVDADISEARAPLGDSPDRGVHSRERGQRVFKLLRRLSGRDREILERFYLREQPRAQICGEMHLTETQFRLFKSRAIAKCSMVGGVNRPVHSVSRIV